MSEHVDDVMRSADEAIEALKKTTPGNAAEARVRSAELMRLNKIVLDAGKQVIAANARKAISGAASNGAQPHSAGLSDEELQAIANGVADYVKEFVDRSLAPLKERLAELERKKGIAPLAARLRALEQDAVKYGGIWNEDEVYQPGTLVTFQGGLWHCEDSNKGVRPGSGSATWMLANKSRR